MIIYLNDILIYSFLKKKYLNHVKQIFEKFRRFNLFANLKKYEFFIMKIEFLNFIIFIINVAINERKIEIIKI